MSTEAEKERVKRVEAARQAHVLAVMATINANPAVIALRERTRELGKLINTAMDDLKQTESAIWRANPFVEPAS